MLSILTTFDVIKLDMSKYSSDLQFENKPFIVVTFEVLKWDNSKDFNFSQPKNIFDILKTWEVSKFVISSASNDIQL